MIDFDTLVIGECMTAFGEPVRYSPAEGVAFDILGVFDPAYLEQAPIDMLDGSAVVNTQPMLGVQLSAFPVQPAEDHVLTIGRTGQSYQVRKVEADGHGGAMLLLNDFVLSVPI